jgi:hypothetical protein
MELIERPNLDAVLFLNSISYDKFSSDCLREAEETGEKKPAQKHIKAWFSVLKNYCKSAIKTKGVTKRLYKYSQNTPVGLGGRLFSTGSIQSIWSVYRGLIMRGLATDIDMKNCHPVILRYICKKHSILSPQLDCYIQNRDVILQQFENKTIGKTAFLVATNSDKYLNLPNEFLRAYDKEMKKIQKQLVDIPEYKQLVDTIPEDQKTHNHNGSAINRILCFYENQILQHAIHFMNSRGIEIAILMFDGLMIYGDRYADTLLLKELEEYVEKQMEGLNMQWAYKEHDSKMIIPSDFDAEKSVIDSLNTYDKMVQEFELTHAKIINRSSFIKTVEDGFIQMTKQNLQVSYEHLHYQSVDKDGTIKNNKFIKTWLDSPDIKTYDDVGVYPNDRMCPANIFNTWRKFEMEFVEEYEHREDAIQFFLKHILILCGNEQSVADYFVKWNAQMIQYPERKTVCPVLISKEGAGKGSYITLCEKMFGKSKILSTQDPASNVWGHFNAQMATSFFINLDELSKKDTLEAEGKIKGLITEPRMMINSKGMKPYPIDSFHRFLITTNNQDPVSSGEDDRRKFIIRSSNELIGNKEYFKKFYAYLEDVNAVKSFYEYLKSIPDMNDFSSLPLPETEYHREVKDASISPIEAWLMDLVLQLDITSNAEYSSTDLLHEFSKWIFDNSIKFEINSIQLGLRFGRLEVDGLSKRKLHGKTVYKIDIERVRKHYNIGFQGTV